MEHIDQREKFGIKPIKENVQWILMKVFESYNKRVLRLLFEISLATRYKYSDCKLIKTTWKCTQMLNLFNEKLVYSMKSGFKHIIHAQDDPTEYSGILMNKLLAQMLWCSSRENGYPATFAKTLVPNFMQCQWNLYNTRDILIKSFYVSNSIQSYIHKDKNIRNVSKTISSSR